jgi:error-prone DNA polymerase
MLARLSHADAFGSVQQDRRGALWQALGQDRRPLDQPLFADLPAEDDQPAPLPPLSEIEQVFADYRATGLSLKGHPIAFYRHELDAAGVTTAAGLTQWRDGRPARVAGLVILRQRPSTAKGITFVTLEDETGTANLVVKPEIWDRFRKICRTSAAWVAHGKLENRSGVIHLVVRRLDDLAALLNDLRIRTRDFR